MKTDVLEYSLILGTILIAEFYLVKHAVRTELKNNARESATAISIESSWSVQYEAEHNTKLKWSPMIIYFLARLQSS